MIVLLLLSIIEINLHCNKDTFLLGEDILVNWEIINTGTRTEYIEKGLTADKFLNDCRIWDSNGREVPVAGFTLMKSTYKIPRQKIEPGDTIHGVRTSGLLEENMNMIGFIGALHFRKAIFMSYIKPGNYYYTLFYWYGDGMDKKIWSDTLDFTVIQPTGQEREPWNYFMKFRSRIKLTTKIEYALKMLKKYGQSDYISSMLRYLSLGLSNIARKKHKGLSNEKLINIEKFATYIRNNVEHFSNNEYNLKGAIECLFQSKLILGCSKQEAKEDINIVIEQKKIPVDKRIRRFLNIKK